MDARLRLPRMAAHDVTGRCTAVKERKNAENADVTSVSAGMGSSIMGCVNGISVCSIA